MGLGAGPATAMVEWWNAGQRQLAIFVLVCVLRTTGVGHSVRSTYGAQLARAISYTTATHCCSLRAQTRRSFRGAARPCLYGVLSAPITGVSRLVCPPERRLAAATSAPKREWGNGEMAVAKLEPTGSGCLVVLCMCFAVRSVCSVCSGRPNGPVRSDRRAQLSFPGRHGPEVWFVKLPSRLQISQLL